MSPGLCKCNKKRPTQHNEDKHYWNPLVQFVVEHEEKAQLILEFKKDREEMF